MNFFIAMLAHRPYVVALVLTFMVVAAAERGWLRMFIWLVVGTFIGWLSEFTSVRTGFPFSWYEYYPADFPDELWIGGIPLFASLSFASISYLGHSAAYTLLSPLHRGPSGIERQENTALLLSIRAAIWAAVLATWTDFVIDPVTHLGQYWFLGKIYFWITTSTAWHFDIPLWNYGGWLLTIFAIVYANQTIDRLLLRRGIPYRPAFRLPHLCLWSIGYYIGNYFFILAVSIYLFFNPAVPPEKQIGLVLANTVCFVTAFIVFSVVVIRNKLKTQSGRKP